MIACWLVLAGGLLRAQEDRLRVVVRDDSGGHGAFLARLRGQTVDLPIDLVPVNGRAENLDVDAQVETAQALARTQAARAVVWRTANDVFLYLATPAPPRLLARRLTSTASDDTSSAALESAAMILRVALKAVIEGRAVGVPHPTSPPSPPTPAPPSEPPAPGRALHFFLLGDWRLASDGVGSSPPTGFGVHLGVGWRAVAAGITGMATLDREVGTAYSQPFWRQNAALFLDLEVLHRGRFRLTTELQMGAAYFNLFRTTGTIRKHYLLMGAELRGAVDAVIHQSFRVPVWVGLGADYIPNAPPLTMEPDDRVIWVTRKFQPRLTLGTGVVF